MNIICGVRYSAMVCKASSSHVVQLGGSAFCQCCSTVTMTKPTDLTYFVSGFLAYELMSMQCSRCQRHEYTICSLYLHVDLGRVSFADGRSTFSHGRNTKCVAV